MGQIKFQTENLTIKIEADTSIVCRLVTRFSQCAVHRVIVILMVPPRIPYGSIRRFRGVRPVASLKGN